MLSVPNIAIGCAQGRSGQAAAVRAAQHAPSKPTFSLGAVLTPAMQRHLSRTKGIPPSKVCTALPCLCCCSVLDVVCVEPNMQSAVLDICWREGSQATYLQPGIAADAEGSNLTCSPVFTCAVECIRGTQ